MIRVLIVDDEFLVRVGLKTFVSWEEQGFELIGEASNGLEAMNLLDNNTCDIILTDICMPEMDGLTLLQQVKDKYPHIRSFILSNHDDFDYVRKALQIGALDYVLKLTMEPQELIEKLLTVKRQIGEERKGLDQARQISTKLNVFKKEAREKRFREIITKQCSNKEIDEVFQEFGYRVPGSYHIVNIQINQYEQVLDEDKFKSEKLLSYSVANIILELLKNEAEGELIELENGKFTLFLHRYSESILDEIKHCIYKYLKLSVCCGVSNTFEDVYQIHAAYLEADKALQYYFYTGLGQIVHYRQAQYTRSVEIQTIIPNEEWMRMIEQRNEEALLGAVKQLYERMDRERKWHPDDLKEQWIKLIHLFSQSLHELGGDIYSMPPYKGRYPFHAVRAVETLDDMYRWFLGWVPMYVQYMKECSNQQWRPEIQAVVKIIQEQYTSTIKLSDLAKVIGFTEAYLSVLFKKETGETLMDFIIRHRMKKARELLRDPAMKIYEVSEAIGYTDPNYFGKLFKKVEGIYPQEYKRKYFNK
ncbi:response regulator [Paenibacillus sp. LMG 31456]|uniref:Response regulator n=1 Tax=Paenibacillus foliorum TaxID=2654974 RepID=A0A972JXQ1_9BACL|nr:response regulator [Paenibacillus foliorum]NOU91731.1 response regulator [Paenibacillus foliorum]